MPIRLAPVLHRVAGRVSGRPPDDARREPEAWAYALRDAAALAEPDMLISHWDPSLEADALRAPAAEQDDWIDGLLAAPPVAELTATRECVALVRTLARLRGDVAASVTGPAGVAAALAPRLLGERPAPEELRELADVCADALAGLIGAYGHAGASAVVVVEHGVGHAATGELVEVHAPLVRALDHHGLAGIFIPPAGRGGTGGYQLAAVRWTGEGAPAAVCLLDPGLWALPPARFAEHMQDLVGRVAGADVLLLSDGPLPHDIPLENLRLARAAV